MLCCFRIVEYIAVAVEYLLFGETHLFNNNAEHSEHCAFFYKCVNLHDDFNA